MTAYGRLAWLDRGPTNGRDRRTGAARPAAGQGRLSHSFQSFAEVVASGSFGDSEEWETVNLCPLRGRIRLLAK
jgi:hypothetical protein